MSDIITNICMRLDALEAVVGLGREDALRPDFDVASRSANWPCAAASQRARSTGRASGILPPPNLKTAGPIGGWCCSATSARITKQATRAEAAFRTQRGVCLTTKPGHQGSRAQ